MSNIPDIVADIRLDMDEIGKSLAYQPIQIQERVYEMFLGFIRELSIQDNTGAYVNGNMTLASKGNAVYFLLTDNRIA